MVRLQKRVRDEKQKYLADISGERRCEEKGEGKGSSNYSIEQLIEDEDGRLRPVKPEDLDVEKHKGLREAFKMIYQWQKGGGNKEYEKGEAETSSYSKFAVKNQTWFSDLVKAKDRR